ncbi:hypothetical protein E4T49_04151 [Aureobasidium sp. EXF-10728]|nr:hypothetical protein E4T49_04151 [Aureobasidium sp. EXF-10728]
MSSRIDLGNLRLTCPATGLDLTLTSNASISTLAQSCNTPSLTDIESGRIWLSPATSVQLLVTINWPSSVNKQHLVSLKQCLPTALQHAALWNQLNLRPSLTVESSQTSSTSLLLSVSLTTAPLPVTNKKAPTHRLAKDVPFSHLKPPEGLPHWTLDQVHLTLDITSPSQSSVPDTDAMLFELPTLLEDQANVTSTSPAGMDNLEDTISLIDAALRLAMTNPSPKALMNIKITERSSFKHLDELCPAMWSPGHLEALASRAVFLPTISHALSNSISQRARSFPLREKLKEISRQECPVISSNQHSEPSILQNAVSIRLWRLMQRRLRDPSAGKILKSIRIDDATILTSKYDEEADNILSFEHENEYSVNQQSEDCLELDDEDDEQELLDIEYESEWEDLFTDLEPDESPSDDDMLDFLHDRAHDDYDQIVTSDLDDEMASVFEDMLEL